MDAGFGREGALAHIGRVPVGGTVKQLVECMRDLGEPLELLLRHADLETVSIIRFQLQRRDDGDEIGVAAAFSQSIERTLDLPRAGAYSGKRIRHRLLGIVMRMDADMVARDVL